MSPFQHLRNVIVLALFARRQPGPPGRVPPRLRRTPAWMTQQVHRRDEPDPRMADVTSSLRPWHGPSDPAYLLAEIEELRLAAQRGGHSTLAYLLHLAAEEARTQARRAYDQGSRGKP